MKDSRKERLYGKMFILRETTLKVFPNIGVYKKMKLLSLVFTALKDSTDKHELLDDITLIES